MRVTLLRSRGAGGFRACRCTRTVVAMFAAALSTVLFSSLAVGTLASQGNHVVPPAGKVAGHGYSYWMQRHWQYVFSLSAVAARSSNPCHILTASGKRVAWLSGPFSTGKHACKEPAGRPIYVNLLSTECSTFTGNNDGGTSDSDLQQCSKSHFLGAGTASATVDRRAVNVTRLAVASGAFPVNAVDGNPMGVPAGHGRSAAYGIGLLLIRFTRGTHTIHCTASAGQNITWIIHVS